MLMFSILFGEVRAQHMHDDHLVPEGASIGEVHFNVSCDEAVNEDFDYALGMMHHMMYASSRGTFEKIIENDPACAMGYWGIATTLFQPLWGTRPSEDDLQHGWQNISKAYELVESDRERLLIQSTAAFFQNPESDDFRSRINRWIDGVEEAYAAYPNDQDVAALYSLTLLTAAQFAENPNPLFDEAEKILRDIFERNPNHPGAIHYTIHATDADGRAENALDLVEAYGNIAPEVPHALHMPSHIYVRLGDWPEVIDWNINSANAALKYPVGDAESHHYVHAIDYLVYAYLQRGEDDKAESVYQEALKKERYQTSFVSAFHFASIPARLSVEQKDWDRAANLEPRTPDYLPWDASPWAEGLTWFARGLGSVHTGDIEGAKRAEEHLAELRNVAEERGDGGMATYIETDRLVLSGWIALADGDHEKAVELTRSAADLEASIQKHPVTPGALQPPNEALGDILLHLHRPAEALVAYEASDAIWPGRLNTLMGAAIAAKLAGEDQKARKHIANLLNSGNSDIEIDPLLSEYNPDH
tara:strand:- start:28102 stop:29697 length:1596 start_codon:yes stop_codon:yes gene_type:complete